MNQFKTFNKFQNVNYNYNKKTDKNDNKKLETSSNRCVEKSDNDITYAKYADDFLDMEIKTPEIKKIKEDINISKENNSSKYSI